MNRKFLDPVSYAVTMVSTGILGGGILTLAESHHWHWWWTVSAVLPIILTGTLALTILQTHFKKVPTPPDE